MIAAAPQYSPASPRDAEAVRRLLAQSALPSEDVAPHLADFIVAKSGDALVGVAGLEMLGDVALLRSVAVREDQRRNGVGQALCDRILSHARQRGAKSVYLLTLTAAGFFQRKFQFSLVDREAAPKAVQMTHEFREACPATASLLTRKL